MARTSILSFYLREQARWRDGVAREHGDPDSYGGAQALRAAADYVDGLGDDDHDFDTLVRAGWIRNGEFLPNDAAKEFLRRYGYRRSARPRDLPFGLACCADPDHALLLERSLRGKATKQGLRVVSLRARDTRRPFWESYALTTQMGVTRLDEATLLEIRDYLLQCERG
ncbi:MAG: hypothetical protein QM619_08815 [Micropruina sp.]|uniref:hypothetical protein n=1 Tax=Micropruina sp. TaxID=2737536 RepID=UPI0039E28F0F